MQDATFCFTGMLVRCCPYRLMVTGGQILQWPNNDNVTRTSLLALGALSNCLSITLITFLFTTLALVPSLPIPSFLLLVLLTFLFHLDHILQFQAPHFFSMRYSNNWRNSTDNHDLIPQVNFLDLSTSVCQHMYQFLPQVGHSMQIVSPVYGYSSKVVSFFLDQYLSDPRHRWPGSEDDLIVMFIDHHPHIIAYLGRKNDL